MIGTVVWLPSVLSPAACRALLEERALCEWVAAKVGGETSAAVEDTSIRSALIQWLPDDHWATASIHAALLRANEQQFNFELSGHEAAQLTQYGVGQHYRWHCDLFYPPPGQESLAVAEQTIRKLSICIQLSEDTSYGGGSVIGQKADGSEYGTNQEGHHWRLQGSALVFPSSFYHCVTPVRFGVRYSAVLWATGPVWR